MNRMNPLYVGVLLLFVIIFLLFKLGGAKDELSEVKEEYAKTAKLATSLSGLKNIYANSKKSKKALRKILALSSLRSANIMQNDKKSNIILTASSMDKKSLNLLMGKLLNASYNITSMQIRKLSNDKVSMKMEIKW